MLALLSPRLWIALAIVAALSASHWKAYSAGKAVVQLERQADIQERTAAALVAEQQARVKEAELQAKVRKVDHDLQAQKVLRVAADKRSTDSLQRLTQVLADAKPADSDTVSPSGADDPRDAIVAECSRELFEVDKVARRLLDEKKALQGFAESLRVVPISYELKGKL